MIVVMLIIAMIGAIIEWWAIRRKDYSIAVAGATIAIVAAIIAAGYIEG